MNQADIYDMLLVLIGVTVGVVALVTLFSPIAGTFVSLVALLVTLAVMFVFSPTDWDHE